MTGIENNNSNADAHIEKRDGVGEGGSRSGGWIDRSARARNAFLFFAGGYRKIASS